MPAFMASATVSAHLSDLPNYVQGSGHHNDPLNETQRSGASDDPSHGVHPSDLPDDPPKDAWRSDPDDDPPDNPLAIVLVDAKTPAALEIQAIIDVLKEQVASERTVFVKRRMEENTQKLFDVTKNLFKLSAERNPKINGTDQAVDLLAKRQKDAIDMQNGISTSSGDSDGNSPQEDGYASSAILLGSSIAVKNAVRPIKLPEVKRLPPYTTWIFLDRNQRMTEDQSVVGRRRIYYDQNGGEALICSDSEEDAIEEEDEKKEFTESEDYILRMTVKQFGFSDVILDLLAQCFSRKPDEIKARHEDLVKEGNDMGFTSNVNVDGSISSYLDKNLDAALDSFDNLFCRRCLVFDCRLHGCSQDLIFPAEKPPPSCCPDAEKDPCGANCYRLVLKLESDASIRSPGQGTSEEHLFPPSDASAQMPRRKNLGLSVKMRTKSSQSDGTSSNAKNICESSDSEIRPPIEVADAQPSSSPPKNKLVKRGGTQKRNSKRIAEHMLVSMRKRQKKMLASDSDPLESGTLGFKDLSLQSNSRKENGDESSSSLKLKSPNARRPRRISPALDNCKPLQIETSGCPPNLVMDNQPVIRKDDTSRKNDLLALGLYQHEVNDDKSWKPIEKALYEKGLEIFGRNSCLIARNLMNGLKTCSEVFLYMNSYDNKLISQSGDGANALIDGYYKVDGKETMGNGVRRRSKFLRRRGRVRRLKYTWKSAGYHSIRKRISERKDQPCRQYNPCGCQSPCGKECPCLVNGTCCEKYCGCPKSCKNRFRGCHCAKSQCRSRQCPCFAADRECDPDVCRNCWISCGDGTLGVPSQRGDNYECRNMKLLLKQQQRVLLGRSDVSGWGAFLKNNVAKHEYLGEYTGELISHREADKRGKIYDRENSSFLFNLNDQFVLDAFRKGDKLKFANHSPDPNCYAKVIMVAGDHRVGIFAKERISAGEELFYDYRYEPDRAPAWAKKPETSGFKKEDGGPSSGRAKKHT
ncbi:histone-lysine N-methyltransferase CLF isoform X2 [Coffea arabica]|uniref:[histone H3]-lysine(27) N-trimethyltransferase n=2 Tax=Coffea TaxID=13442 RepID=A0ABM4V7B6_COFAR